MKEFTAVFENAKNEEIREIFISKYLLVKSINKKIKNGYKLINIIIK